jgi:hypothetical protein
MSRSYIPPLPSASMACNGTALLFYYKLIHLRSEASEIIAIIVPSTALPSFKHATDFKPLPYNVNLRVKTVSHTNCCKELI